MARGSLFAIAAVTAFCGATQAGDRFKGVGSSKMSCPWWRPCGSGETYGGNKFVPQVSRGVDGRAACQRHDDCYDTAGTRRKDCDKQFLNDMLAQNEQAGNPPGTRAKIYFGYISVRILGGGSKRKAERVIAAAGTS